MISRTLRWSIASVWIVVGLVASLSVDAGIRWRNHVRSPLPDAESYPSRLPTLPLADAQHQVNCSGINNPPLANAHERRIANSLNVIGLVVDGRAYAYAIKALSVPTMLADESELRESVRRHVVNQLLGDTAVSVTYCDACQRVRVFKQDKQSHPLSLGIAGAYDGKLVLTYAGQQYLQDSPQIPLLDHPFEVTFWGDWLSRHPTSQIYLGG